MTAKKTPKKRRATARTARRKNARASKSKAPRPGSKLSLDAEKAAAQEKFLTAYARVGNVTAACELSKVGRRTHYNWLELDPDYAQAFGDAKDEAVDSLDKEARRRALDGIVEPVYGKLPGLNNGTGVVGTVRKYSDTLLIFLLKGLRPDVYKDRAELTGKDGAPLPAPAVVLYMPANGRARRT